MNVLAVDDEAAVREVLALRLESWGYRVSTAADVAEAERQVQRQCPDVVLSDVVLPGATGVELLKRLKRFDRELPVILITAHRDVDTAVDAMKAGAQDFLTKPLDYPTLHALLEETAAELRHADATRRIEARLEDGTSLGQLVGYSQPMRRLYRTVRQLAASSASGIITGESGTGKEAVARTVHELGDRHDKPFVAINAAAIPESLIESELFGHEPGAFTGATRVRPGCFELADGGTLFLDEIAEMPVALQSRLLRIIEDGRTRRLGGSRELSFDVRVLAATNRVPATAVKEGLLREDLLYRLNVFELTVPPLRERLEDIGLLAQFFIRSFDRKHDMRVEGVRRSAQDLLEAHVWPGNVRELRNVIERAVIVAGAGWIEAAHLPAYLRSHLPGSAPTISLPAGTTLAEAERTVILQTLERMRNNKAAAARVLGIDVKTIRNKLKNYGYV